MKLDIVSEAKKPFPFLGHVVITLCGLIVLAVILYYTGYLKFFLNLFGYGADEYLNVVTKYCKHVDSNIAFKYSISSNDEDTVYVIANPKDKYTLNNYGGPHIFMISKKIKKITYTTLKKDKDGKLKIDTPYYSFG